MSFRRLYDQHIRRYFLRLKLAYFYVPFNSLLGILNVEQKPAVVTFWATF